ncbi:type IV pilus modification protein PilV [Methylibium rhizosphaerae]|uniref:type IV pilus modification protein PilV n=1 Tax=Methylibium rhizosphaerae TaxID=2570323 RepID=UPI00112CE41A|nr:type IV pilus modification protein PilV [Methylibium rhizosphaerae]
MCNKTSILRRGPGSSSARARASRGVTLVEVLVAVLVMSIGMLGIAGLQARALKFSQSSYERSVAVIQAQSIVDSMRANSLAAKSNAYNIPRKCDTRAASESQADRDLAAWIGQMQTSLSGAAANVCGGINCNGTTGICIVTVQWDDTRGNPDKSGTQQIEQLSFVTQL